jgi:DNA repair exonuclease SbcCD ATPase subunit
MGNRYIYNRHIAPITANARDGNGRVLFTKTFQPERLDTTTGRVISTGYTALTEDEYKRLNEGSKTFTVYRDKHKLLVEYDELPPEAKTPQEALVDARNEARKAAARIAELESEIVRLKAGLLDAETRCKEPRSASTDAEVFEKLRDRVSELEQSLADVAGERDKLKKENAALKATGDKNGKGKGGKEFS